MITPLIKDGLILWMSPWWASRYKPFIAYNEEGRPYCEIRFEVMT